MLIPKFRILLVFCAVGVTCATTSAAGIPLVIDKAHSELEFQVNATMHSFTGRIIEYDAEIVAIPGAAAISGARLRFAFAAARTGDKKRDHEMLEWEEAAKFPGVEFVLEGFEPLGEGKYTASGQLTLHGVRKNIQFPVSMSVAKDLVYSFDGDAELDVRDFGLPVIRKFGVLKVQPRVRVRFHLQADANRR